MTNYVFKPRARLLLQLGEQLIRNENIALLELVKNSYDADATKVEIRMEHIEDEKNGSISIEDDGSGMDSNILRNAWMEPGSDFKEKLIKAAIRSPRFKRFPLGEKGIGRFGAHKLGDIIQLTSKKKGCKEVCLEIDWTAFQKAKYLNDVSVRIVERDPKVFLGKNTGTRIVISGLKASWDRAMVRESFRSITALCSPFDLPESFTATLKVNKADWLEGLQTWDQVKDSALFTVDCKLKGSRISKFTYNFSPWPAMNKLQSRKITEKNIEVRKQARMVRGNGSAINLSEYKIGTVRFKAYIFDRDAKVLELGVQDKRGLKEYLDINGGIRVYREGIRVYDYGEPGNDWLNLGTRRVNLPTKRISNNLIVGAVLIDRIESADLREKSNREGFIETKAYETFSDAVLYTLGVVETFRNKDKEKIRTFYGPTLKSEPVISTINDLRQLIERRVKEKQLRSQCVTYLQRIETDYRYINETLLKSAGAGLSLSVVVHEADKIIAELSKVIQKERPSKRIVVLVRHLSQLLEGYTLIIRDKGKEKTDLKEVIVQALFTTEFRLVAHKVAIVGEYEKFRGLSATRCATNLIIGSIINLIDNSIWWLNYAQVKNKKILITLEKYPEGYLSLILADNGSGFSLPTEELAKPFVSTKPGGMGLGLHIVKEVMEAHGGKLLFPESNEVDIPTEFKKGAVVALAFKMDHKS